jgi:predicted porin
VFLGAVPGLPAGLPKDDVSKDIPVPEGTAPVDFGLYGQHKVTDANGNDEWVDNVVMPLIDPQTGKVTTDPTIGIRADELAYNDTYNLTLAKTGSASVAGVAAQQAQLKTMIAVAKSTPEGRAALAAAQGGAKNADWTAAIAGVGATGKTGSNHFDGWGMDQNGRASRLGVKGSEDLGNGLKAVYQMEFDVRVANDNGDNVLTDGNRNNALAMRNTYAGLAGNWGTFLMGRHDTPLKMSTSRLDLFADTLADMNFTVGFQDLRADNAVAYVSPSLYGLNFSGAVIPAGGATGGTGWNSDADGLAEAWSTGLTYSNGPFFASAAYENLGSNLWTGGQTFNTIYGNLNQDVLYRGLYGSGAKDDTKWRLGLGLLNWNGFTLQGIYENRSHVLGAPDQSDMQLWQLQAQYAFGNTAVKGMYGHASVDQCADPFNAGFRFYCGLGLDGTENSDMDTCAVGVDHNFSKRTKAYLLYTAVNSDNNSSDWNGVSIGMMHSF